MTLITSQQLDQASRDLIASAGLGRIAKDTFRTIAPTLARQIEADARSPLLDHWGLSVNYDEHAHATIVHPKIVTAIGLLSRRKIRVGDAHHAGLMHTYGYLLSMLKTPYGLKRDRWMKPTIESGLRLPRQSLRAEPKAGTLLQNLTYFLGRVVHRGSAHKCRELEVASIEVDPRLRGYDYDALDITRITAACSTQKPSARRVTFITDLVKFFPCRESQQRNVALLVYSLKDPQQGGNRLITAFSVGHDMMSQLLADDEFGSRVPIRPRYNCYVDGFAEERLGTRRRE